MKRKFLSTLTALCMVFALLPSVTPPAEAGESDPILYVGNTLVSDAAASEAIYWEEASGAEGEAYAPTDSPSDYLFAVSYDESEESFTLTLNGVNVTTQFDGCGIFCNTALDIVLADASDNIVSVSHNNPYSCAVRSWGELTVDGSGKLELSAEGSNAEGSFSAGIEAEGDIFINGGEIIAEADTSADTSYGLRSNKDITISDGNLTVSAAQYGLYTPEYNDGVGGAITISGGIVNIDAGIYGIVSNWGDVTVSGGTVIVDVSNDLTHAGGTAALFTQSGNITVFGGTVIANAEGSGNYGIQAQNVDSVGATVSIDGGAVYAYGSLYAMAVGQSDTVTHPSDGVRNATGKYVVILTEQAETSYNPTILYNADVPVEIGPDETESPGLYVGGFPFAYDYSKWATAPDTPYGNFSAESSHDYTWSVQYNTAETSDNVTDDTLDLTLNGLTVSDSESHGINASSALNLTLSGKNSIDAESTGIRCVGDLHIAGDGDLDVIAERSGISATGDLYIEDGQLTVCAAENGLISEDGDILLSGGETELEVICGSHLALTRIAADYYGLRAENGTIGITDARVSVEKFGNMGDGIHAEHDIRISGNAHVDVIDRSTRDISPDCGLHSDNGSVAIGGNADVNICSQSSGIYAKSHIYLGYIWNGHDAYSPSGTPTVVINNAGDITAVTPDVDNDFAAGNSGIMTGNGSTYIAGGSLESAGAYHAILLGGTNNVVMEYAPYQYKTNTTASCAPETAYVSGVATPFVHNLDYKYVEIKPGSPEGGGSGGGGSAPATRTITVTETSSSLFSNSRGTVSAQANMTDAFSNSVEVKVTDTEENSAAFGFSTGTQVYPFDISLYIKGTNTKTEPKPGYTVTIALPIPENLLDVKDALIIVHKAKNGTVSTLSSRLEQKDGVWYLVFAAADFSPYALVVDNANEGGASAGVPYYLIDGNKVFIGFAANGAYIAPAGVTVSLTPNTKYFTDISGHWAADYIRFVTEREIFLGTRADIFSPNAGMNRAMFATVIGRLYERSFGDIAVSAVHDFNDCNYSDYYGKYIDWAAKNAIITGYGNGTFAPNDAVTREQMAVILYRFAVYLDKLPESNADALRYTDAAAVSSRAKDAALYCHTTAIISGRDGGAFAPQATATRAEVATIIERFAETIVKQ